MQSKPHAPGAPAEMPYFLTVDEACALARIGRSTFYRALKNEDAGLDEVVIKIPGIRGVRLPRDRFMQWLEGGASAHSISEDPGCDRDRMAGR